MRVIVYEEPGVKWGEPLPNDWHLAGLELKRQLIEAGFDVFGEHECVPDPDQDIALYFDTLMRPQGHPVMHKRSIYISLEPPVVGNQQRFYDRINGWPYTRILTFSKAHVDDKRVFYSPFPNVRYERKFPTKIVFNPTKINIDDLRQNTPGSIIRVDDVKAFNTIAIDERTGDMVAITANKTSGHPAELYSARREVYRAMGKKLHLYGHGWRTDPICNFVDYRGPCEHIFPVFQQYKYAISIENQYLEGYCSEKYWTPLQAGCELIRIGWKPDFALSDCDEKGWAKRIVEHVEAIA